MINNKNNYTGLEIAVIGMACRFPGADDWRTFWKNLETGMEAVEYLSEEELIAAGISQTVFRQPDYVNARVRLQNKDLFDAAFFDYRPGEAELMNPMHRIFHECVWEALEDAGYDPGQAKGLIGLFAGGLENSNWKFHSVLQNNQNEIDDFTLSYLNSRDYLASLLSYKLNLKGPAVAINTACSTSLVTVNMACKSLLMGETNIALAGGVSIVTEKQFGYQYQQGMIASKDGHCKTFDSESSGTIRGEGAGVVVLKRMQDAVNDGDNIYAVIKGSAINNDGNRKVGFTAPGVEGQADCIKRALKFAKVDPATIGYVEAHGTGTNLGDPIELAALNIVFGNCATQQCPIGSVKTNIGHLDTAAGIAGFIKTVLSLKNNLIPASLHFKEPNPAIDFKGGPFYVNTALKEWMPGSENQRRAGVSSFGIGGTNAHVVLEESPPQIPGAESRMYKLLTVSARSEASLVRYMHKLKLFLQQETAINLSDMSYTLQAGRKHFIYRKSLLYTTKENLVDLLNLQSTNDGIVKSVQRNGGLVFLFPGQGTQFANMGIHLYTNEPMFREQMDKGFAVLKDITGEDYKNILYAGNYNTQAIHETKYTQPIVFLFEYALAQLLISLGISPAYMIGHSVGEYVAACISGVFSFEHALKILVNRGRLMNSLAPGMMISVRMREPMALDLLNESISIAAVNGPEQVVFSGDVASVEKLVEKFQRLNIDYTKLATSHAFHSSMLDPILDQFRQVFEGIILNKPQIPFISNLTGILIKEEEAVSPAYWVRHMRGPVRFSDGLATLLSYRDALLFVEAGAGQVLTNLVKNHGLASDSAVTIDLVKSANKAEDEMKYFTKQVGELWAQGVEIAWQKYYGAETRKRVSLPTYSFDHKQYTTEVASLEEEIARRNHDQNPAVKNKLADWIYFPSWKQVVSADIETGSKSFLVFSPGNHFADAVIAELLLQGDCVIEVLAGDDYNRVSGEKYHVNPSSAEDYKKLFTDILASGEVFTDIVYLWGTDVDFSALEYVGKNREINLLYFGMVNMLRALAEQYGLKDKQVFVITDSLQKVTGTEEILFWQSLALGLVCVIPQEYELNCLNIDVNERDGIQTTAASLAKALKIKNPPEGIIALRHGQRWLRYFEPNIRPVLQYKNVVKKEGLYLITGGLGKVGYVIAKYLLQRYGATVILTGRRHQPDTTANGNKSEWIDRYNDLLKLGGNVIYFSVDTADLNRFEAIVNGVEDKYGRINGVVHAAGITDNDYFEFIEDISAEKTLALFQPKVKGIEVLYTIFKDRSPDFVWVTSSISSVLGGLGYASYAAANLFLDYFICSKSNSLPVWRSVGLAELAFTAADMEKMNHALSPDELCELFDWSVSVNEGPMLIQTKTNLHNRLKKQRTERHIKNLQATVVPVKEKKRNRPDSTVAFVLPGTETEKSLKLLFEDFFGVDNIGVIDDFFELGGDSLNGMILLKKIKKEYKINLQLVDFLKNPNVRLMAAKIDEIVWLQSDIVMKHEISI